MAGFELKEFRGENIARDERLLDITEASSCEYAIFDNSGALAPHTAPWKVVAGPLRSWFFGSAPPSIKTLFRYDDGTGIQWLYWTDQVEVARGPVIGDTLRRLYLTGDGVPKMTHSGIAPTWRTLGIPAPTAAPSVSATLPETALAGTITSITCANLKMIHECKTSEGRNSGNGETNVVATTTPVYLTAFPVGTRVKVASVVDANNVTVTGVGDTNYSAIVDKLNYGLRWTNSSGNRLWRSGKKAYWNFLIPSGVTLAIASHGLDVGDVLQITATSSVMSWEFTTMSTSPNTDQSTRTATAAGTVVFTGDCNFIIDRGGTSIDPLVPSQNYLVETRAYVYTHVSDIGEESAPSPASDIVSVAVGDPVTVGTFAALPGGYTITHRRIYRTNTATDGTELQFVTELPVATASYDDSLDPAELGEVIPSETWEQPPSDMRGITTMPNGMMAGFTGKTLCFCEPGYPHAYPPEYQYQVENEIVSIAAFGNSLFVGTEGAPYVFSGVHPRQMAWRRIPIVEPCIGLNSAINIGDRVAYVSPNGVIVVSEDGAYNLTAPYIPIDVWRARLNTDYPPLNIRGYFYGNTLEYIQTSSASALDRSPLLLAATFIGDKVNIQEHQNSETNSYVDEADGSLHIIRTTSGASMKDWVLRLETKYKFDQIPVYYSGPTGDTAVGEYWGGMTGSAWTSKRITFDRPMNFAWARVAVEYDGLATPKQWEEARARVVFKAYLDNRVVQEFSRYVVYDAEPARNDLLFRLPEGFLAESMTVTLTSLASYVRFKWVRVGESIEDVL